MTEPTTPQARLSDDGLRLTLVLSAPPRHGRPPAHRSLPGRALVNSDGRIRSLEISLVEVDPEQQVRTSLIPKIRWKEKAAPAGLAVDHGRKALIFTFDSGAPGSGEEPKQLDRRSFVADFELNEERELAVIHIRFTRMGVAHPPRLR